MASKLFISSRDRLSSGTSTNFSIKLNEAFTNISKVSLKKVIIPRTQYIFRTGKNNIIDVKAGVTTTTATITPGNYTGDTLATHLKTILDATTLGTFTVTYSSVTLKLTVACTVNYQFLFSTGANVSSSPWYELGFLNSDYAAAATNTSDNVIQLQNPTELLIDISQFSSGNAVLKSTNQYGAFIVPLSGASGEVVFTDVQLAEQKLRFGSPINFSYLTIKLFDRTGVADLGGADWSMILEIS